jgi:hypothetical protein
MASSGPKKESIVKSVPTTTSTAARPDPLDRRLCLIGNCPREFLLGFVLNETPQGPSISVESAPRCKRILACKKSFSDWSTSRTRKPVAMNFVRERRFANDLDLSHLAQTGGYLRGHHRRLESITKVRNSLCTPGQSGVVVLMWPQVSYHAQELANELRFSSYLLVMIASIAACPSSCMLFRRPSSST